MNDSIHHISLIRLGFSFIPVFVVIFLLWKWNMKYKTSMHAVFRMLIQLLLIGYFLHYIFEAQSSWIVLGVLLVMLVSSSWIALRTMKMNKMSLYKRAFIAILLGGGAVLIIVTQVVLDLQPWFLPSYMIPLAGMIFANAMNSISLAGERLESELHRGEPFNTARNSALHAALIPITNTLFAVGLVSLPGMMTGQILSGVSPFIAARYQIMVMCMIFGSTGISAALFLTFVKHIPMDSSENPTPLKL